MKLAVAVEYSRPLNSKAALDSAFKMASAEDVVVVVCVITNESHIGAAKVALEPYVKQHELTLIVSNDPKEALLKFCNDFDPHILFLTTRKTSGLERLILGSTASYLIKHVSCNVMVCK